MEQKELYMRCTVVAVVGGAGWCLEFTELPPGESDQDHKATDRRGL